MPRVRVKTGPNQGQIYTIGDESISMGRDTACTIQILDKGASRQHAEIFRIGEMCFIRDLQSRNGTFVNDEKVIEELLREGDRVQIGSTMLVFESSAQVKGETKGIHFTEAGEENFGQTLELRLDDLAGFEEDGKAESRDTANFRALFQLGKIIAAERDEQQLMDKILKFLASQLPADNLYLFVRDEQTNNLVAKARLDLEAAGVAPVSRTVIRRCIQEQRSIMTSDASADARFKTGDSIIINRIRSVMCVPLVSQERIRGVLYLTGARAGQGFVEEDLELATAVGTQAGVALENLNATRRQRETMMSAIRTLTAVAEMRDPGSVGHAERVAGYAIAVAETMGLPERQRTAVQLAALLHDIGKAALNEELGRKGTRLDLSPQAVDAEHVRLGLELAGHIVGAENVLPAIASHHERHDGSGFPKKLKGDAIPVEGRIVGLANVFDRMLTSGGPEGHGLPMKDALMAAGKLAEKEFDPEVVKALLVSYRNGTLFKAKTIFGPAEPSRDGPTAASPAPAPAASQSSAKRPSSASKAPPPSDRPAHSPDPGEDTNDAGGEEA